MMYKKYLPQLARLRARRPLVHCLTNQVTINLVANSLLALGASPIMSHSPVEVEEVCSLSQALCLNIGGLSKQTLRSMLLAGGVANQRGIPVVLDPVGAGVTAWRAQVCQLLLKEIKITAIRGNASEVRALAGLETESHGVDSAYPVEEAHTAADILARRHGLVVALTGVRDYVCNATQNWQIEGGHELMAQVSGMGCAVSALLAAWLSVDDDSLGSAVAVVGLAGFCGRKAGKQANGPGSFVPLWLDELHQVGKTET